MRLYKKIQDYLLSSPKEKISRLTLGIIFAGGFLSLYGLDSLMKETGRLERKYRELNIRTIQQEIAFRISQNELIELARENLKLREKYKMKNRDYSEIKKFPVKI